VIAVALATPRSAVICRPHRDRLCFQMSGFWRVVSLRGAPRATRLKVGIVLFANADSPLAQLRYANLTGRDDASASRFADRVEAAPILEGEDALRFSGGFGVLTASPFAFVKRHGYQQ
jgi:hypothetical protein